MMSVPCEDCVVLGKTNNLICPKVPKLKLTVSALHLPLTCPFAKCLVSFEKKTRQSVNGQ